MGIVMVAMLAFGGTFAYFTANAEAQANKAVTTGQIQLKNSTVTVTTNKIVSGMELLDTGSSIVVTSNSNVSNFIFVTFEIDLGSVTGISLKEVTGEDDTNLTENTVIGLKLTGLDSKWKAFAESGETASADVSGTKATLIYYTYEAAKDTASDVTYSVATSIKLFAKAHSTEAKVSDLMNKTVTMSITSKSIQAYGFGDADTLANAQAAYKKLHA